MNYINEEYIEEYIRSIIHESTPLLKKLEEYAMVNHVPIIHPEVAQFLRVLLKIHKPLRILEVGTAIGYSAIVMASATGMQTYIDTIEKRADMVEIAKENIKKAGLNDRISIKFGEAEEVLPNLKGKYDFIFLDAAKGQYLDFFESCIKNLKPNGVIVSDNVLYKGMVANDELVIRRKKTIVKRMRKYLDYISDLDGFASCVLPLGDGVAITHREEE